jgi:VanZ family protein
MKQSLNFGPLLEFIPVLLKAGWGASLVFVTMTSLSPGAELPARFWNADKFFHFLGYSWLAFLPLLAFARSQTATRAALSMIALGCALELCQAFIPGRSFSIGDLAANTAGVLAGLWLGQRLRPARMRLLATRSKPGANPP